MEIQSSPHSQHSHAHYTHKPNTVLYKAASGPNLRYTSIPLTHGMSVMT